MKRAKQGQEDVCASSSQRFDDMVADLDFSELELDPFPPAVVTIQPQQLPVLFQQLPSTAADFNRLYEQISMEELKSAAATLANKNSNFDLTWEFYLGQLSAGIEALQAQNVDTSCVFVLSNMAEHLRTEQKTVRSCSFFSALHLIRERNKEELNNQRRFRAAKSKAKARANKRKADAEVHQALKNLVLVPLKQIQQQVHQIQQVEPFEVPSSMMQQPKREAVAQVQYQQQQQYQKVPVLKIKCPSKPKKEKRSKENVE